MTEEKEQEQDLFDGLIKQLIILSLPADFQIEYIGFGLTGDELANDFDNYYTSHKERYGKLGFINQEQEALLDSINTFFEEHSGIEHEDFWDDVKSHSDWVKVRRLAKECLGVLGKQDYGIRVRYENEKTYFDDQEQWNMHSAKIELVMKSNS